MTMMIMIWWCWLFGFCKQTGQKRLLEITPTNQQTSFEFFCHRQRLRWACATHADWQMVIIVVGRKGTEGSFLDSFFMGFDSTCRVMRRTRPVPLACHFSHVSRQRKKTEWGTILLKFRFVFKIHVTYHILWLLLYLYFL